MCTVSVIVPFYNGNKFFLLACMIVWNSLAAILKKVEVIVVNDSPKVEVEKARLLSNKYELMVINHLKNAGIHKARVTGLGRAKGEYILFLDQDDKVDKRFFAFANGGDDSTGKRKPILNSYGKVLGA